MVKDALKVPKIVFMPKQKKRDAANSSVTTLSSGNSNEGGEGTFG